MKYRTKFVNKKDLFKTVNLCFPKQQKSFEDYHYNLKKEKETVHTNSNVGLKNLHKLKKLTKYVANKFSVGTKNNSWITKKRTRFYNFSNAYLKSSSNSSNIF